MRFQRTVQCFRGTFSLHSEKGHYGTSFLPKQLQSCVFPKLVAEYSKRLQNPLVHSFLMLFNLMFYVYEYFVGMYARVHVCTVSEEIRGVWWIRWYWDYRWFQATMWTLSIEPGPLQESLTTEQTLQPTPRHFDTGFSKDLSLLPLQLERTLKSCGKNALEDSRFAPCCWICAGDSIWGLKKKKKNTTKTKANEDSYKTTRHRVIDYSSRGCLFLNFLWSMLSLWSNKEDLFKLLQHPAVSGLHTRREPEGREWGQRGGGWGGAVNFWQSHKGNAFAFSLKHGKSGSLNQDAALFEPDGFHIQTAAKRLFLFFQRKSDASRPRRPSGAKGLPAKPCYLLACSEGHWRTQKVFPLLR